MADCILEQIAQKILTALDGIRDANDPPVVRPSRWGVTDPPVHRQMVLIQREQPEIVEQPTEAVEWSAEFGVMLVVSPSEDSSDDLYQLVNNRIAAIQKVVMSNYNWSGLAINTELGAYEYWDLGVVVPFRVRYRTLYADPYTQA